MARGQAQSSRVDDVAPKYSRSIENGELPTAKLDSLDDDDLADRAPEVLVADESVVASKEYAEQLAFMNEPVEILLHPGREKFAPLWEGFYVNGVPKWVQVNVPTVLPRCYVEVMARAQQRDIRTESAAIDNDASAGTVNRIHPSMSAQYHFSVLRDPNPRGRQWLASVMSSNA